MSSDATSGSTVIPCLRYRDAPAAIDWLCAAFGFERRAVYPSDDGGIAHAQLVLGGGMLMLSSVPRDESPVDMLQRQPDEIGGFETESPYIVVADADAVYASAKAQGAQIVVEIHDADYGGRGFSCRDNEGHLWHVGSYDPWKPAA
ncbi:VOC family protein [Piscinibacter sakaiensis]|uniref:VOC family protein n=1 Tax=Piscinibacter sakaiensis TaxID=1547922 RepID=UPI003AABD57C